LKIPRPPSETRPAGVTAEASTITSPAPPCARAPRCTRCQSVANPSTDEYWHIGETPMRLAKSTERSFSPRPSHRSPQHPGAPSFRHIEIPNFKDFQAKGWETNNPVVEIVCAL